MEDINKDILRIGEIYQERDISKTDMNMAKAIMITNIRSTFNKCFKKNIKN